MFHLCSLLLYFLLPFVMTLTPLKRDGSYKLLIDLFHNQNIETIPERIRTIHDFQKVMEIFSDYIIAEPLNKVRLHPRRILNCSNSLYSSALNGILRPQPVYIIDIIPFGYDLDMLEIRLLENYDMVDLFVIFETPRNQRNILKPLYFQLACEKKPNRFEQFQQKILHLTLKDSDIQNLPNILDENGQPTWVLEKFIRKGAVDQFIKTFDIYARTFLDNDEIRKNTFVIQNDGDEIISGHALLHFKYCSTKLDPPHGFYPVSSKFILEFMEITSDSIYLGKEWAQRELVDSKMGLNIWRPGPTIDFLETVLQLKDLDRYKQSNGNFGPGAAIHMSSPHDLPKLWLKKFFVIEGEKNILDAIPHEFLTRAREKKLTPEFLIEIGSYCPEKKLVHLSAYSPKTRQLLSKNLPCALRRNRHRYPFIIPPQNALRCVDRANCYRAAYTSKNLTFSEIWLDQFCPTQFSFPWM